MIEFFFELLCVLRVVYDHVKESKDIFRDKIPRFAGIVVPEYEFGIDLIPRSLDLGEQSLAVLIHKTGEQ